MERGKNLAIDLPFLWWSFLWAYPSIKCRALESCLNDGHWWPPGHRAFIKTLWRTTNTPATVLMFRGDPSANRVGSAMEAVDRVPCNPCICMHLSVGFDQDESFRMCYNVLTRSVGYLVLIFFCGCCFFFSLTSKSQHLIGVMTVGMYVWLCREPKQYGPFLARSCICRESRVWCCTHLENSNSQSVYNILHWVCSMQMWYAIYMNIRSIDCSNKAIITYKFRYRFIHINRSTY